MDPATSTSIVLRRALLILTDECVEAHPTKKVPTLTAKAAVMLIADGCFTFQTGFSLQSCPPIVRLPAGVCEGNDPKKIRHFQVIDDKRKTAHNVTSGTIPANWKPLRRTLNRADCFPRCCLELQSQAASLALIKGHRRGQLQLGLLLDQDGLH